MLKSLNLLHQKFFTLMLWPGHILLGQTDIKIPLRNKEKIPQFFIFLAPELSFINAWISFLFYALLLFYVIMLFINSDRWS